MLFCVSRARIKIVFVCGSASLKCEMGNGKWKMLQGGGSVEWGGGTDEGRKKKRKNLLRVLL